MNKEDLFRSMNNLDADLIEESEGYGGTSMKHNRKKILVAAAAAVAVFVAIPNVSATAAHAMESIPVLGKLVEVITFRNFEEEGEGSQIHLDVPAVSVDGEAAGEINAGIGEIADRLMEDYRELAAQEDPYVSIDMSYEILCENDPYFTLKLNCFKALGGGYAWNEFYTIDRTTGEQLHLADLFTEGCDYVTPISRNILEQMTKQMEADETVIYFLNQVNEDENFKAIDADQSFFVNAEGNLVICFDEYEVAPGYMGAVEFESPAEVLRDILA